MLASPNANPTPLDNEQARSYVSPKRLPRGTSTVLFDPKADVFQTPQEALGEDVCPEGNLLHYATGPQPVAVSKDCRRCFAKDLVEMVHGYGYCADCGYAVCSKCLKFWAPQGMCQPPLPSRELRSQAPTADFIFPTLPPRKGYVCDNSVRDTSMDAVVATLHKRHPSDYAIPPPSQHHANLVPYATYENPPCAEFAFLTLGFSPPPRPASINVLTSSSLCGGEPGKPGGPIGRKWITRGDDAITRKTIEENPAAGDHVAFIEESTRLLRVGVIQQWSGADDDDDDSDGGPPVATVPTVTVTGAGAGAPATMVVAESCNGTLTDSKQHASADASQWDPDSKASKEGATVLMWSARDHTATAAAAAAWQKARAVCVINVLDNPALQSTARLHGLLPPIAAPRLTLPAEKFVRITETEGAAIRTQQARLEVELSFVVHRCLSFMEGCTHLDTPYVKREKGDPRRGYYCEFRQCTWCGKVLVVNGVTRKTGDLSTKGRYESRAPGIGGRNGDAWGTSEYERMVFDAHGVNMLRDDDAFAKFRKEVKVVECGVPRGRGWSKKRVLLIPEVQHLHRRGVVHTADARLLTTLRASHPKLLPFERLWLGSQRTGSYLDARPAPQAFFGPCDMIRGSPVLHSHEGIRALVDRLTHDDRLRAEEHRGAADLSRSAPIASPRADAN